jgi:cobalt-zinc-cadmium efflux system protein
MHVHEGEQNYHRAFFLGVLLNVVFVAVELVYGHIAGSLALVADAWHNLSDVLGLLLAWGAYYAAARRPSPRFTYGLRKSTILAALGSAVLLLIALGAIAWEAIGRFVERPDVEGEIVLVVAGIGFVINTITALLFFADRKKDLNLRGAFLHMAADALVSLGVVVSGLIMMWTGWSLLDPILSLGIVLVILMGTWDLLRDSLKLSLDAVPEGLDIGAIERWLQQRPGVQRVHDLWPRLASIGLGWPRSASRLEPGPGASARRPGPHPTASLGPKGPSALFLGAERRRRVRARTTG